MLVTEDSKKSLNMATEVLTHGGVCRWSMGEGGERGYKKMRAIRDYWVCENYKNDMPLKKLGEITKMIFFK